jgi:hypothetical protein
MTMKIAAAILAALVIYSAAYLVMAFVSWDWWWFWGEALDRFGMDYAWIKRVAYVFLTTIPAVVTVSSILDSK